MLYGLYAAIMKLHPKIKMTVQDEFLVFSEVDEFLIKEVEELVYSIPKFEKIRGLEWTVVDEMNYMALRPVW